MTGEKPEIEVQYDKRDYSEEQIAEVQAELSEFFAIRKSEVIQFSVEPLSCLLFFLKCLPVIWFSKGLFTTLGTDIGHELSSDIIKTYRKMKQRIAEIITRPSSNAAPTVVFQIPIMKECRSVADPCIKGIVRSRDETVVSECFDRIDELWRTAERTMAQIAANSLIARIEFDFDSRSEGWEPKFCELKDHTQLEYKKGKWERLD